MTLFIPLAGRRRLWPKLAAFLNEQVWPRDKIRLVLFDTSQSKEFSSLVRDWLAACDYPDVHHLCHSVGKSGLADRPRGTAFGDVTTAMVRIYSRMVREVGSNYVWVLEDDVLPPIDACERLFQGFDDETASVSAAYWSRFGTGYVAWSADQRRIKTPGQGVQDVGGNGFGCVLLRKSVLSEAMFVPLRDYPAHDNAFYHRLRMAGFRAKVDWSVVCEHRTRESEVVL